MRVLIPTPLRPYAGKQAAVELAGTTVGEALSVLTTQHPDLRRHLFTEEGKLRSFVNVYVNDEDIRYLQREDTPVGDADTLAIVPSVAGGCSSSLCACCCC
ncbi:MAG TPA: ubiquitin-like small modifier protein 1 [Terriglobales bacterium]|nr:ubiquitin-like small modifier protein 1 [Terriglobales bacterium]